MQFNSAAFLFLFLPVVVIGRWLAGPRWGRVVLIAASSVFIASWGALSIAAVAVALGVAALALAVIDRSPRAGLVGGVAGLTAILAIPKLMTAEPGGVGLPAAIIGLSFITLNLMSVVIDRYRGRIEGAIPPRNLLAFGTAFPYIAAGPLVRWRDVVPQFGAGAGLDAGTVARALLLIGAGLAKKTLIADQLGLRLDQLLSHGMPEGLVGAWLACAGFGVQVYFDFSGYTDMAMGIGLLLGLKLPPNFDAPYRATSIADFWRRWHMTLAAWVRDYVYLGLGFGRSHMRAILNMVIAMALVGLWHGFTWTFLAWGVYHGVLLAAYYGWRRADTARAVTLPDWLARAVTLAVVTIGWSFFRAPSIQDAALLIESMFGLHGPGSLGLLRNYAGTAFLLGTLFGLGMTQLLREPWQLQVRPRFANGLAFGALFALGIMALGGQNPFLYMEY
jgi:alginate O-acetyltransferase complex protein AlgI